MARPNKHSLLVLAMLLALASADTRHQDSFFRKVKEISTVITNKVIYTPPMLILGQSDGSIVRCPHETPASCEVYHTGSSAVTATLVHGEYLFVTLKSGTMLRCSWQQTHSCSVFNQADSGMSGLAVAAGYIHVGLENGTVLRCSMNTPHSCRSFADFGRNVTSLAASSSFIYVGAGSRIDRCDTYGNCSLYCSIPNQRITGLAVFGDNVFGILRTGYIVNVRGAHDECEVNASLAGYNYGKMAIYDEKIYAVRGDNPEIRTKLLETLNSSSEFTGFCIHNDAVSISFAYATFAMQEKYRVESIKCIWRGVFTCPPTVVYYTDLRHRASMEVFVKNGSLFDSQGLLVDTSEADESHSQRAAIFVMGPDGQILLSNLHKTGLLHTSSLLAGNPVSGAGLMVVERGKIRSITACSVHYRPDQTLNEQVRKSLRMKGYNDVNDTIEFRACSYNDNLCVYNANI